LINLAIDFGAAGIFVFLFIYDSNKQNELNVKVEEKLELKKESQKRIKIMKERELEIGNLKCLIRVGVDQTQEASIRELQVGAKQHIIIVAGPKKVCRDALIGANLLKMDFAMSNVLVVPYDTETTVTNLDTKPVGFGSGMDRPIYETQPYVTKPIGDGWYEYIQNELQDAIQQNGEQVKEEGIAIVIANNGKVVRRGVGKVPWRQMVDELQQNEKKKESNTLLS
jgi:ribosome biogenesis protein Nip4